MNFVSPVLFLIVNIIASFDGKKHIYLCDPNLVESIRQHQLKYYAYLQFPCNN